MASNRQNFEMFAGDAKDITIAVTKEDGTAADLTGMTFQFRLARHPAAAPLVTKAGIAPGSPPTAGNVTVSLVKADTQSLDGLYYHETKMTDGGGKETTVSDGTVAINKRLN